MHRLRFAAGSLLLVACGVAYRRTRSWAGVGKAALWVVLGYIAFAAILHLVGFE